ncbi:MAG: hypothetical protein HOB79_01435 [Rhodospirillaceae bacterium]|jgi:hypothetical protein|nr:hypothetical protein [Rhodospirillales bacterium]MBT3906625.1 hypothetical protein [Rhodospirillaceae bacterium]MBT4699711.1 hypothetical protein [Rhodospirillaceae bacterium]MBT5033224.1 hypothetical protein [Rhodospirillaceae bacterium]MBT6219004.1 hypothetical protein [Rhodospirillaceae bacterium]
MAPVSFGQTFSQITANAAAPAFELQFSQIQNTLIRRLNGEIDKLSDDPITDIKLRRLRTEGQKLIDAQPVVEDFLQKTRNSLIAVQGISDDLSNLNDLLGADDNVTQAEVDAFVAQRDAIGERINNLFIFSNVDIPNFDAVKLFKDQLEDFQALTPVVGTKSVDNAAVTAGVSDLTARSFNAEALIAITVEQAVDVSLNIQRDFIGVDSDILVLETSAFAEKQTEIDNLKADAANLLQIFSLAFDAQAKFAQNIADSLRPQTPAPGSVLNLFA